MGDSLRSFFDAVQVFVERLAAVEPEPLAIALGFVLLNVALRTRAWRNIITAAYPHAGVRWRHTFGAYSAGIAVNSVLPARAGDPVKLVFVRRRVPGSTYPTLAATLVAETVVDAIVASALLVIAWQADLLPVSPRIPDLPAFEVSWIAEHPWIVGAAAAVVLVVIVVLARKIRQFWARVKQGLVILTMPGRFARQVAVPQLLGWGTRFASAWYFLEAFHVPPSLKATLLVQVASSVATIMPATPGGVGPKQALLVLVLGTEAARSDVLAFSVGMEAATTVLYLVLGATCLVLMTGGLRFRSAIRGARADQAAGDGEEPAGRPAPVDAGVGSTEPL